MNLSATHTHRLLVIDGVVPAALGEALERSGVTLVHSSSDGEDDCLDNVLGCAIWFYEGMRSPLRVWRLSRRLRRHGIPIFAWNRDAPHYLNRARWRLDWYDRAKLLDIYATHTLADARTFAESWLYFPNAADITRYNLSGTSLAELRAPDRYEFDVSFFGAMDGDRYPEMRARQEFFAALGEKLRAKGLRFLFRESNGMPFDEQVRLVQTSRINLNFGASCEFRAEVASGLPERCFGIPACGGFLLCDTRTHARDDFSPGIDWAEFENLADCEMQISHWLANFDAARDLAELCHFKVMRHHTYDNRAHRLRSALLEWQSGRRGQLMP